MEKVKKKKTVDEKWKLYRTDFSARLSKVKKVMDSECKGINKLKLRKLKKWWNAYYEKIVEGIDRKKVEAMADSAKEYTDYYESLTNLSYYPKLNDDRSVKMLAIEAMDNVC